MNTVCFTCDDGMLSRAARVAYGDLIGNCCPFRDGLLTEPKTCVLAGLDYDTPWTRDTGINCFNAVSVIDPAIAYNTLLSVCETVDGKNRIGGQYWDAVIWSLGAFRQWQVTADRDFLTFAADVIANTLAWKEAQEQDPADGLFRGAAVYQDGISAYDDAIAGSTTDNSPCILDWNESPAVPRAPHGFGLPCKALSTNCVYVAAYRVVSQMLTALGKDGKPYADKADTLSAAINRHFWNDATGRYDFMFYGDVRNDRAEGIGLAFAILFGIADKKQCDSIVANTYVSPHGIPCVWPSYQRYLVGGNFGRHSGTVWPHVQGFWALAMLHCGHPEAFDRELRLMAEKAVRDNQLAEIYHPMTGEIYGGVQENFDEGTKLWKSCDRQTWSDTAYWSLLLYGVAGLRITPESVTVRPYLPAGVTRAELTGIRIGDLELTVRITKGGGFPKEKTVSRDGTGALTVELSV